MKWNMLNKVWKILNPKWKGIKIEETRNKMENANLLSEIKKAVKEGRVRITNHADEEMAKDGLAYSEVGDAISKGEIIETYADDKPFPSCLIYGEPNEKHIHAVCAYSEEDKIIVLITVYIPDQDKWINYKKRRR